MKEHAIELGVPSENILLEERSKDVLGNAYFSRISYLEPSRWKNVIVITSGYHVPRAEYVFKKILGQDYVMDFLQADNTLLPKEIEKLVAEKKENLNLQENGWKR